MPLKQETKPTWWQTVMDSVHRALESPETALPVANQKKLRPLSHSEKFLRVESNALIRALVLQTATELEWSGYGPLTEEDGGFALHDFYFLSNKDTYGSSDLGPEAVSQAWERIIEEGYDIEGMKLAWVHCHPWGMYRSRSVVTTPYDAALPRSYSWSSVDNSSIDEQIKWAGSLVSVLFCGSGIEARYDDPETAEALRVVADWGGYADDVARAQKLYLERPRPVVKKVPKKKKKGKGKTWPVATVGDVTVPRGNNNANTLSAFSCARCEGVHKLTVECFMCKNRYCVSCMSLIDENFSLCLRCEIASGGECGACPSSDSECYMCKKNLCKDCLITCELCGKVACFEHSRDLYATDVCEDCTKELFS